MEANPLSAIEQPFESNPHQLSIYPNPAASAVWVEYELMVPANSLLELYDLLGRRVSVLFTGRQTPGFQKVLLPLPDGADGTYILKFSLDGKTMSGQVVVVKP